MIDGKGTDPTHLKTPFIRTLFTKHLQNLEETHKLISPAADRLNLKEPGCSG
jgi:hypothetical protein